MSNPAPARRDIIIVAALAAAGVGGAVASWPLIASLLPRAGTPPPPLLTVDLASIQVGQSQIVSWRGKPIAIRHRTGRELAAARTASSLTTRDHLARNDNLTAAAAPATDTNRAASAAPHWLIVIAVCTHDACVVRDVAAAVASDEGIGWFCPCCASRYDLSGRAVSGPAPRNLPVPRYRLDGNYLHLGTAA